MCMKYIYLSKSKYCRAKQCNKMLWLDKNMPEVAEEIDNEMILAQRFILFQKRELF